MPKPVTSETETTQVKPDPALEKRSRRKFSPEYKLRIIQEADACQHGELGNLLRREKLYSNQLQQWRREFAEGGVASLSKSAPGPKSKLTSEQKRIAELEKKIKRLEHEMLLKDDCLYLQKKPCRCSSTTRVGATNERNFARTSRASTAAHGLSTRRAAP